MNKNCTKPFSLMPPPFRYMHLSENHQFLPHRDQHYVADHLILPKYDGIEGEVCLVCTHKGVPNAARKESEFCDV